MFRSIHLIATAVLLALGACADGGTATRNYVFNRDLRGHIQYAAYVGPTQAVIHNSPFDSAAVIAAMQQRNPGPPLTFGTGPSSANYRVVVSFGEPPVGQNNFCQAASVTAAPAPGGRADISAQFCIGGTLLSEASVSDGRIDSPQDPRFGRLMGDLLAALMPYNDPLYNPSISGGDPR